MTGTVVQINISQGGVPKRPIPEAILIPLGIMGDAHAHPQIHGGLRQALLLIASEAIDELIVQGYPLFYGALGENLTTRGIDHRLWRIGQRLRVGDALIEFTKIRQPCDALNIYGPSIGEAIYGPEIKRGEFDSPKWGLSGFYASVVRPATIYPNAPIVLESEIA
jgi:MOSC domain-containing protein YiiM